MKYEKLGELAKIKTGKLDANMSDENGKYPFFTCSIKTYRINNFSYDCECVLVAGNGDLNVKYYDGKFDAYQRTYIIESINKEVLDTKFLYYFLCNYIDILRNNSIGGVIKYIKLGDLTDINIPLLSLDEQLKIVNILDKAKELMQKSKEALDDLGKLVKSRFIEMFGNPFTDDKNFGMNKLGSVTLVNPKKAEVKELDDDLYVSFVPMDRVGEKGEFKPEVSKPIKDVYSGFTYFKDYDILFAKITPCMENGKGAVAKNLTNGIGFGSTEFHVLRPLSEKSNPYWIYHLTTLIDFRRLAERKMTGSAGQKRVPTDFINNIEVVIPPIELQNQFAEFVKQVDKLKFEMEKSLKELEDNFNSLMQKAFKGELFN